ncbi:carboxymuconolactone decarboxylase family protein [Mycobacterium sp.]|jgi:4-carboxymuconolactone decarboxylase|uniref:carboxymuconolactone decarboxylase family protein n=1 Tax=Mycobacterium sp. TaxID=1785 RepID=UPI002D585AC2|nr:carboxymuconolactone decarboxylase family protein [Mycobacterium sp.]HZA10877.1 carboxymuconolactone decarboxylase family protein [Mycobacterium sp.]
MARLPLVSDRDAGLSAKITYYFMKRHFKKLTGREAEAMLDPIRAYAHIPKLLSGYGKLEQAVNKVHLLDLRHRALAELKAATTTRCEYCIDLGSRISRDWGLSDEELLALPNYRTAPCFSDVDKLVLDYATAMSRTPVEVSDELFDALREHFDVPQLVELTHIVALENLRARFNLALGIGSAGFSEGMVCAIPG